MNEIPWLLPEAITFLDRFCNENKNAKILEFGMGGSSIWLEKRTDNLISVDHNKEWVNNTTAITNGKSKLNLLPRPYNTFCDSFDDNYFDLILIDGRDRVECIKSSIRILRPGGILMLDNSERTSYNEGKALLADWFESTYHYDGPNSWSTSWWRKP